MNRSLFSVALLAAAVIFSMVAPSDAVACLIHTKTGLHGIPHPMHSPKEEDPIDLLNEGRDRGALHALYRRHGVQINGWAVNAQHIDEQKRDAVLVAALATLRSEGAYERDALAEPVVEDALREGNLKWAIRAIENLAYVGHVSERHLAEAWARDPSLQTHALHKLESLWKSKRLLSPFQVAQLERLYRLNGRVDDAARAKADRERLQQG